MDDKERFLPAIRHLLADFREIEGVLRLPPIKKSSWLKRLRNPRGHKHVAAQLAALAHRWFKDGATAEAFFLAEFTSELLAGVPGMHQEFAEIKKAYKDMTEGRQKPSGLTKPSLRAGMSLRSRKHFKPPQK